MARRSTPLLTLPLTSSASLAPFAALASSMPPPAGGGGASLFAAGGGALEAFKSARWNPGRALDAAVAAAAVALQPFLGGLASDLADVAGAFAAAIDGVVVAGTAV